MKNPMTHFRTISLLLLFHLFSGTFAFSQGPIDVCGFEVEKIEDYKEGSLITIVVGPIGSKFPKVTLQSCGQVIKVPLPDHFSASTKQQFPIPKVDCSCSKPVRITQESLSPLCSSSYNFFIEPCEKKIEPPEPEIIYEYKYDTIYKTVVEPRIIEKIPYCKTCFKWWECFWECHWYWLLGSLVGVYFWLRLLLVGTGSKITIPLIGGIVWSDLWEFLCGSFAVFIIALCPCQSAVWGLFGISIAMLMTAYDLFRKEKKYPEWRSSLLITIGLTGSLSSIIWLNCGAM